MKEIVKIEGLTKSYGKHRGVADISFSVEKGDVFGFLGPNGAGKSTTIRSMLGFIGYEQGKIEILGMDRKNKHEEILRNVGYMPSEAWFYNNMTVKDTIKFAAKVRGINCDEEAKMLCDRLQVDVHKKIEELSLGNRKKVSIVCAMQHKPKLFVFDEPTSGLDPLMQSTFFELIDEYVKQGATCMLSTHVLSEVRNHCNKVAIMKEGRLILSDTSDNLLKTGAKHITITRDGKKEEFIFRGNINDIKKEFENHDVTDILIEEPSIEDIFMHFYEGGDK